MTLIILADLDIAWYVCIQKNVTNILANMMLK